MNSHQEHYVDPYIEPTGEFAASIRDFRSAVTHVAERETARPIPANWLVPARKRQRGHQRRLILGWACAALLCCATLPLATHSHPTQMQAAAPTAAAVTPAAQPDTGLLEQVDADVSESVPPSLAPLTELDTDSSLDETTETTTNAAH